MSVPSRLEAGLEVPPEAAANGPDGPTLLARLRKAGLIGTQAATHGAPDEIGLFSGGAVDARARWTIIAAPPRWRCRVSAPTRGANTPTLDAAAVLTGDLRLEPDRPPLHLVLERWTGTAWAEHATSETDDLAAALRWGHDVAPAAPPMGPAGPPIQLVPNHTPTATEDTASDSRTSPPAITPAAWTGTLAYDLARWSTPIAVPRHDRDPLALLWRPERWLLLDRRTGHAHLVGPIDDGWCSAVRAFLATETTLTQDLPPPHPVPPEPLVLETSPSPEAHIESVERLREGVRAGAVYQANLARRWRGPLTDDPWSTLTRLLHANPAPQAGWIHAPDLDWALVSASPETLLTLRPTSADRHDRVASSHPIKGTGPRDDDASVDAAHAADLLASPKERAEHRMLVDLVRHDLGAIAAPGTVSHAAAWLEHHPAVHHLTADVTATLRPDIDGWAALAHLWPGGSISGCPKVPAVAAIAALEPAGRGLWCGSLGWHDPTTGAAHWNLLIRSLSAHRDPAGWTADVWAGGGIVIDSVATRELEEAGWKAAALQEAAGWVPATPDPSPSSPRATPMPSPTRVVGRRALPLVAARVGGPTPGESWTWRPGDAVPWRHAGPRVLMLDLLDSFSWNVVHAFSALGGEVAVLESRRLPGEALGRAVAALRPSHVVIGPGPGGPEHVAGARWLADVGLRGAWDEVGLATVGEGSSAGPAVLGLCLGHQVLCAADGWRVERAAGGPVHGRTSAVRHDGAGLFSGLASPVALARYHSLVAHSPGPGSRLEPVAWTDDALALVQGVVLPGARVHGVQPHPESVGSPDGAALLRAFLAT